MRGILRSSPYRLSLLAFLVAFAACDGDDDGRALPTATVPAATATPTAQSTPSGTSTQAPTATPTRAADTSTPTPTMTPTNPVLDRTPDAVMALPGLPASEAYVAFDSLGIPHIYGSDRTTALFVQGYETARVRFWQMDIFRRAAEGRLSELFGRIPGVFEMDVEMRTVFTTRDGRRIQEALWERLQEEEPELAATAQAYTAGINAWLADLRARRNGAELPPEYGLIGIAADGLDDWRSQDSVAIGRLQSYSLSSTLNEELNGAEMMAALPEEIFLDVIRSAPAAPATVLPPAGAGSEAAEPARRNPPLPPLDVLRRLREAFARTEPFHPLGRGVDGVGSNNWIVAPELSASGHAMLANDPHLQLFNPSIWHMVQLDIETEGQVTGVNFPGLPGIILGHNDFGAWGATVAVFDVTDVYLETVTTPPDYPSSPRTVLFEGEQVPVLRVEEEIGIAGGSAATVVIEVVPHHGPMVPDPNLDDDVEGLAATNMTVRWTGQEVTLDSRFLDRLNRARNVEEFKEAVRSFAVGAQNWIWADVDGNIAYFPYALVPQRPPGTVPYLPMDGTGSAEWLQDGEGNVLWLPEEKFPQATNPAQGFLATANNDQIGNTLDNDPLNDDVYLTFTADLGFREQRIQDVLSGPVPAGGFTQEDMSALQYDVSSLEASRLLPFLFAAADARPDLVTPAMQDALDRLSEWGVAKEGSPAWNLVSGVDAGEVRDDVPPREQPVSAEELADAAASSLFAGWSTRVSRATLRDDFAAFGLGAPGGQDATKALLHILEDIDRGDPGFVVHTKGENGESTLWDDRTTPDVVETRDEILLRALADTLTFLAAVFDSDQPSDWLWGGIHRVQFQHFIGTAGIPLLDLGPFPAPGGRFTVNPGNYSMNANNAGGFVFSGGPSKRFVAVLDPDGIRSVSILPGGNNANPCLGNDDPECGPNAATYDRINPEVHYGDHAPGWIRGETFAYRVEREDVAADTQRLVRYVPEQ